MIDKMEDSRTKVVVVTSILVSGCLRKWEENLPKHDMIELKMFAVQSCNELSASCCAQVQVRLVTPGCSAGLRIRALGMAFTSIRT